MVFYILLKAVDRFYSQYHRYPGLYSTTNQNLTEIFFPAFAPLFPSKCKTLPWHWCNMIQQFRCMVLMRYWASDDVAPWSLLKGRMLLLNERQIILFANFVVARIQQMTFLRLSYSVLGYSALSILFLIVFLRVSLDLFGLAKLYPEIIPALKPWNCQLTFAFLWQKNQ